MPTRLLREGILTSDRVNKLGWGAEVFYRRLMSKVDDHGLFDARIPVLRASLYPIAIDRASENNCKQWLSECESAGLLLLYDVDGKRYMQMLDTKWQIRSTPKYPIPTANNRKQPQTPVYLDVDVVVDEDVDVKTREVSLPDFIPKDLWLEFKAHRKQMKVPVTALAESRLIATLTKMRGEGSDIIAIINLAIERGWKGFYAPDNGRKPAPAQSIYTPA